MEELKHLDIIVPCYNEEDCVELFYNEVKKILENFTGITYSVLYVDDGSKDTTLDKIKKLEKESGGKVKYISLSRNFNKEAAMYAGISFSKGDYVAIMDVDLQDPPSLIPDMIEAVESGYDCCVARRTTRKGEPPVRSFFAELFYKVINSIGRVNIESGIRDFRVMTRQMADEFIRLGERERFTKGLFPWLGFKVKVIEYENVERAAGKTRWSFFKLCSYAISGIVAFTTAPLRFASVLGVLLVLIAVCYGVYMFLCALFGAPSSSGFTTLLVSMMFIGGITISLLGVIGEYLARIYQEVKARPIFIVRETNIDKENEND